MLLIFLTSRLSSPYSSYWIHILYFARDVLLINPSSIHVLSTLILPTVRYFNGNHTLSSPPRVEWCLDYHAASLNVIEELCTVQSFPVYDLSIVDSSIPLFMTFIQQYLECTFQTVQTQHLKLIQQKYSERSDAYIIVNDYIHLVHCFVFFYTGDAFTVLSSFGVIQLLYGV